MRKLVKIIIVIILLFGVYSCISYHPKKSKDTEITVTQKPVHSVLYYSSIIEPLKTVVITAPTDGVIDEMFFHFGDVVKPGQPLFYLSSDKFQADYKTALMEYIKAKTEYANNESQLHESEFLHANKLISDDDYKARQTGFYTARLSLVQAKESLDHLQKEMAVGNHDSADLKIEDIDKITKVLHEENTRQAIHIVSSTGGIILSPDKNENDMGNFKKMAKGDFVRQNDVIAVIGDANGILLHIAVSEFDINQIKPGQSVKVTGAAFPDIELTGKVSAMDRQGIAGSNGTPVFPVEVIVPTLTAAQQKMIRMGMSARVAIDTENTSKIMIPIQAVFSKNGKTLVQVRDQKNGSLREVAVNTGETTLDSVVIESGLLAGDKIVIPHSVG